jgi:hypothetical protein
MDRQTRFAIDAMTGFDHVVLDVAAYSVLWAKQGSQLDLWMFVEQISGVTIGVID